MKISIKFILNTIVSLASFIGGVYFCALLIFILIGLPGGDIPFGFSWKSVIYICMLSLIYGISLRILYIKVGHKIVKLSICIFIAGVVFGPAILTNSTNIINFFRTPSHHTQLELKNEIQKIISRNDLPYRIDSKESEERTKYEVIRTVILMVREQDGQIKKNEVKTLANEVKIPNIRLVLFDKSFKDSIDIIVDEDRSIRCDPSEFCN
ncbi:hypothetical protein J2Z32_001400 [Paenibacillus turicensis]|uniref:Uncharacterized protein n=1 Tax=Paenibacillus turicensis TaxID=160487 RepID=A0ABS4FQC0_9BACL|nr:hypothetical protein [Paenibacillus turicensis]MBP1904776.1 hypothetical protein [Paenibacillus turicensis]